MKPSKWLVENLGIEHSQYFQGYGLGPNSEYTDCCYGIGDTESEALDDCLENAAQQGLEIDDAFEAAIRDELNPSDLHVSASDHEDTDEVYFHVGLKWCCE